MKDLRSATLLSVGQLCDDKCTIVLDKQNATIYKNNKVVLSGVRNLQDGLWDIKLPVIHLPKPSRQLLNAIIRKDSSKKCIADYMYKSCFSPPMSTFSKALQRGHFIFGRE